VLFVIYTLPTVVISRRTDQYGKVRPPTRVLKTWSASLIPAARFQ